MKSKGLFSRTTFWLQVIIWAVIFIMPISFKEPDDELTLTSYLRHSVLPLCLMLVFYVNYLWLGPKFFSQSHKWKKLLSVDLIFIAVLAIGLSEWMTFDHERHKREIILENGQQIPLPPHQRSVRMFIFGLIRDTFTLSAAAIVGGFAVMAKRIAEMENARKEAELLNLRNQVSPHFLLNTLNNIYALTAFNQSKAQEAIMELSKMLRYLLYNEDQPSMKLQDEVEFVHNYIELMRLRLPGHVTVEEDIHIPTPCTMKIAPMIIISLVENAFKHGISPTQHSEIVIHISADDEAITCDIHNTYFPKDDSDRSGHGIGLQQVQKRLDLSYPGKYEWAKGVSDNCYYISNLKLYDTQLHDH